MATVSPCVLQTFKPPLHENDIPIAQFCCVFWQSIPLLAHHAKEVLAQHQMPIVYNVPAQSAQLLIWHQHTNAIYIILLRGVQHYNDRLINLDWSNALQHLQCRTICAMQVIEDRILWFDS